jgi:ubiquinone/menaquinone biosynthesis C-methylase UbiE
LDIGCGNGATLLYLRKRYSISGVGIDVSQEIINEVKNSSLVNMDGLKFQLGDHRDIKLPSDEFDIVLSWGVIEHLTEYIQSLAEAKRVLKRNGVIIIWCFAKALFTTER